jgi:hypothetical protein
VLCELYGSVAMTGHTVVALCCACHRLWLLWTAAVKQVPWLVRGMHVAVLLHHGMIFVQPGQASLLLLFNPRGVQQHCA